MCLLCWAISIQKLVLKRLLCFTLVAFGLLFASNHAVAQKVWRADSIRIEGNKKTKPYIILREITWKAGDIITADTNTLFERNANQIFNTNLFVEVKIRSVAQHSLPDELPTRIVIISLHERWYTFPFPIIELADRSFNEWWYNRNADLSRINYGIRMVQYNCRGRQETLKTTVQWGFTHKLEASYTLPYINKKLNSGLSLGVSYITNNNIAYATQENKLQFFKNDTKIARYRFLTRLSYTQRIGLFANHQGELGWAYAQVADTIVKLNPAYFGAGRRSQRYGYVLYRYTYDRRDRRVFALKGYAFALEAEKWGLLQHDDVQSGTVRLIASGYKPLGGKWYAAARAEAEVLFKPELPYYNYKMMGYEMRSIRGYEKYVVEGQTAFMLKTSLRKQLFSSVWYWNRNKKIPAQFRKIPLELYLQSHHDLGYVGQGQVVASNERLTNSCLAGGGLGLVLVTFYNMVFRAEYSINRRGEHGTFLYFATDI